MDDEQWGVDAPEPEEPEESVALVPEPEKAPWKPKTALEKGMAKCKKIEDRLLLKNLRILENITAAADYDDDEKRSEVTPEEVKKAGSMEGAIRRKRIAMDARRPSKYAPVYLSHAKDIAVGILKARAVESKHSDPAKTQIANITVHINGDPKSDPRKAWEADYEEVEVEGE